MFSVIALIAGIVGIAAVFMVWMDSFSLTGWEIIREAVDDSTINSDDYFRWMPLVVLVFSVIGILNSLASVARPGKVGGMVAVISGLLIVIATILFASYTYEVLFFEFRMYDYLGIGVYVSAIAGIIMLIFGAMMTSSKISGN
jgi:hypothetical protein